MAEPENAPGSPGKKGIPYSTEIFRAVGIGLVLYACTFVVGLFDDTRKATPGLQQQIALMAQEVKTLSKDLEKINAILNAMQHADNKISVIEYKVTRLEQENQLAAARAEAQYRELISHITNVQRNLVGGKP